MELYVKLIEPIPIIYISVIKYDNEITKSERKFENSTPTQLDRFRSFLFWIAWFDTWLFLAT